MRQLLRAVALLATVMTAGGAAAQDRPVVVAVAYPLAFMAERLAGDAAQVVMPVAPGQDPAFWRPTIAEIGAIQQADVILLNGAGFSAWTTKTSLPRARTVDTSRALADALIPTETVTHSHGADGAHSHTGTASFVWLDPALASRQAEAVAAGLKRALPDADLDTPLTRLQAALADLSAEAAALGALGGDRLILASHPRYQYLGRATGLEIVGQEWEAGAMPEEGQWAGLMAAIDGAEAPVFLWEAEPPAAARQRMADLGVRDIVFPTLAQPPADGDFLSSLTASLARLREALGG